MPTDSAGVYRHNDQSARMHSEPKERVLSPKAESEDPGEDESIHEHLRERHAETGHAHSHIEHHGDGTHTSHHIDAEGETSGPHDHENMEALKDHMDQFLNEEGNEKEREDGAEQSDENVMGRTSALGM